MKGDDAFNLAEFDKGVFLVNALGIIFDPKTRKILIGRRENDPYVPELKWCFPGGRPKYGEDIEEGLKRKIKEKTNLDVESLGVIFARVFPENEKFLLVYYLCELIESNDVGKEKAGKKFVELKWVAPDKLEDYFSTSFDPRLKEYIMGIKLKDDSKCC